MPATRAVFSCAKLLDRTRTAQPAIAAAAP
jgi:hypothetical protein